MAKTKAEEELEVPSIDLSAPKKLTIRTIGIGKRPSFLFQGEWAARDIQHIVRHIVKAFRQYQQDVRRSLAAQNVVSDQNQEKLASAKGA